MFLVIKSNNYNTHDCLWSLENLVGVATFRNSSMKTLKIPISILGKQRLCLEVKTKSGIELILRLITYTMFGKFHFGLA